MLRDVRRTLLGLSLAFALAFTQLGATVHALSHVGAEPGSKHYPADTGKNCPICHAFSATGAAAPAAAPVTADLDAEQVQWQRAPWAALTLDSNWSYARGPPRPSVDS